MARDVRTLTKQLAENPDSMVFLELAEKLRVRGQLHGAAKVLVTGLTEHPGSADAHDLYARVLVDMGHLRHGYEEWVAAVSANPRHVGARKGLGFLCFRWGDLDGALEHLELALAADPMDPSVVQALRMVRDAADSLIDAPPSSLRNKHHESSVSFHPGKRNRDRSLVFGVWRFSERGGRNRT